MPEFGPIGRRDLIRYLRKLGFEGPYSGESISIWSERRHVLSCPTHIVATLDVGF